MKLAWYAAGTGGLAVVLAWWLAQTTGEVTAPVAQRPAQASPSFLPVASALTAGPARPAQEPGWAAPTANPVRHAVVPITLAAPQRLQVGEQTELVVGVGGNAEVDDIRLTLRFDPNVLQVRAGAPGEWSTGDGHGDRFAAEIPEAADQVQIRSTVASRQLGAAGGTVALVQFQAVAQGTTTVTLADIAIHDRVGRPMPSRLSASSLHVTVEAAPPPLAGAGQPSSHSLASDTGSTSDHGTL